jgi:mRNA interferase MazF
MGAPAIGSVVLVPFPFSDLSGSKLRPALVIASAGRGDWICAQITSNAYSDETAVQIQNSDFVSGTLSRVSFLRPGKLFTANESLFRRTVATLFPEKFEAVLNAVISVLRGTAITSA